MGWQNITEMSTLEDMSRIQMITQRLPKMNKDHVIKQVTGVPKHGSLCCNTQDFPNMGACVVIHRLCLTAIWLLAVPREEAIFREFVLSVRFLETQRTAYKAVLFIQYKK